MLKFPVISHTFILCAAVLFFLAQGPDFVHANYRWLRELPAEHIHYDKGETAVFVGAIRGQRAAAKK